MDWKNKEIDLGNIESRKSYNVTFEYVGNKEIRRLTSSCGCTKPKLDNNIVKVTYQPSPVAKQTKDAGMNYYSSRKYVTVYFTDNTNSVLLVKAKIFDELPKGLFTKEIIEKHIKEKTFSGITTGKSIDTSNDEWYKWNKDESND